jgi:hypothetical protein
VSFTNWVGLFVFVAASVVLIVWAMRGPGPG